MILKQVTDTQWEIEDGKSHLGTVEVTEDGYRIKTGARIEVLPSLKDIIDDYDMEVREKSGLPVKHHDFHMIPNTTPPMYRLNSVKAEYAAGYWAIKNHNSWVTRYCPSVKTLQAGYAVMGPYATRSELKKAMRDKCI